MKNLKILYNLLFIVISCFFFYSCSLEDGINVQCTIVAGETMMNLKLGDDFKKCIVMYGEPASSHYYAISEEIEVNYGNPRFQLLVSDENSNKLLDDLDVIVNISINYGSKETGVNCTTSAGNGVGSSLISINSEFGECRIYQNIPYESIHRICVYNSDGIAFGFYNNTPEPFKNCNEIFIFIPEYWQWSTFEENTVLGDGGQTNSNSGA